MALYWKLALFSVFQCLIGFNALYHLASLNALQPFVYQMINDSLSDNQTRTVAQSEVTWIWSLISTIGLVGCTVGSLLIEPVVEKCGRRLALGVVKNIVVIFGSGLQLVSCYICSWQLLLIGRFICTLACPFSAYSCVYVAECSPKDVLGIVSASTALGYRVWTMLGVAFGLPALLGTESLWPLVLIVPAVPALAQILLTPLHPESPKHLFITKDRPDEAKAALRFFHGPQADVDSVLEEYAAEKALRAEQSLGCSKSVWEKKHFRWPLLICVVSLCTSGLEGTDIVNQYSVQILIDAGVDDGNSTLYSFLFIQLPSLALMAIGIVLLYFLGRRTLLLIGFGVSICGCFLIAITAFEALNQNALLLAGMGVIVVGDSVGPCLVRFFLPAELCPQSTRSLSASWSFCSESALSTLITLFWPPLMDAIGISCIWILIAISLPAFIFLYAMLPETKDKTVNQVLAKWINEPDENIPLLATN